MVAAALAWRGACGAAAGRAAPDCYSSIDSRQLLRAALAKLSPRQRAVVVLRYHQDLSEAQVADLLGISVGTVKSQAAKALAAMREQAALEPYQARPRRAVAAEGGD